MEEMSLNGCTKVIFNCGNIASWNKMRKKVLLTSTQELSSSIENTLISTHGSATNTTTTALDPSTDTCIIRNPSFYQTIKPEDRNDLNITLKLFLTAWDGKQVSEAIIRSLEELGLESVDTVIVSFPLHPDEDNPTLEMMAPVWQVLERAAEDGRMRYLGTSDLNMKSLKLLFDWATVKPRINQINLAQCCTIPKDLAEYAKQANIRLLTHNDQRSILTVDDLSQVLTSSINKPTDASLLWQPKWVSRFHAIVNLRGIISHKGYIVKLENSL